MSAMSYSGAVEVDPALRYRFLDENGRLVADGEMRASCLPSVGDTVSLPAGEGAFYLFEVTGRNYQYAGLRPVVTVYLKQVRNDSKVKPA